MAREPRTEPWARCALPFESPSAERGPQRRRWAAITGRGRGHAVLALSALALALLALVSYVRSVEGNDLRFWLAAVLSGSEPARNTADDVPVTPAVQHQLGVNTFLEQEVEPYKRALSLSMARDAGIRWIRQQFRWEEIEPLEKGVFIVPRLGISSWEKYDHIVELASTMGIEIIARLDTPPLWARGGNPHAFTPPQRLEDFGDFVETTVTRYRGRVRYYQIWNEPNLSFEWGNGPVDPEAMSRLLEVAYTRAKQADPNVVILAPALAPTLAERPDALNELIFMQRMYNAGAGAFFDVGSVQAYGLRSGPDDRRLGADEVNFSRPILFRELMVRNGDAAKPIWISEMGWNAPPPGVPGPYVYGRVNEEQQARYTVRAIERARTEWPWVGVMNLWYLKRADDADRYTLLGGFRILDPDFTPRRVYEALKAYATTRGLVPGG